MLALNFKPFIAQDDAERVQQHFDAAVTGKPQRYEVKVVGPNGSKMILDMTHMPIIVDNQVIGIHGVANDITASRNYAIEIEQQNARLTEIAWALSHDVRGPLARMMGLMQVIKKGPEYASDFQKVLPMMSESADELDNVIRGIVRQTEDLGFTHSDRQLNWDSREGDLS